MQGNPVLTLQRDASLNQLKLQFITEKNIPETLNGESGFHVYHVRMLTELLLRELAETDDTVSLREEEITGIAIASSLHDIGKAQVPKAILDYPGQLSPLEYDIVKKHAAFGEEMIAGASAEDVDPAIVRYAAEIARHHHERIDGTGYPDGLRGAEIPLCAQVVALADSYDALTSPRSYKEEYSQDVALQMISGGMCGIFDEKLVSCLVKVVNHRSLVELREALVRKQRVTGTAQELNLSRVLCIGNTEYLTKEFIDTAFGRSKVTVVGSTTLGNADRIKLFHVKKPSVRSIFETYEFDMVVYFSGALRWQSTEKSDSEELREVLHCIAELQPGAKMLYFSPLDSAFRDSTDRAILSSANERLCEFYARQHAIDLRIVQIPYLYSGTCSGDFLYRRFEEIYSGKTVKLGEAAAAHMHFISLGDLADLVARMIDGWKQGGGMLSIGDEFGLTFGALGDKLASLGEGISVDYTESGAMNELQVRNKVIRSEYGWFAKVSILEELPEQYARFVEEKSKKRVTVFDRIKRWMEEHAAFIKVFELILLFFLSEVFIRLTDSAVIFSIVDFRLVYIVIMATLYGLPYGIASASLASLSYFAAKVLSGTSPLTIFYEPTNWLAFVFFFLVGALCGYVNLKKADQNKFVSEQNELLENKLIFTRELYEDTLFEKKELKKQIISSKDSFGKIFDVTRRLNTVEPQQLYLRTIETFEEILDNKTITVYSVSKNSSFGRLEVASGDIAETVARSISMDTYASIIGELQNGGIWKNTKLLRDLPMYAAGVYRGEELVLLIFLWHADADQRSLYYVNLFRILRDLVQMALLRAYDYNKAAADKQYLAGTHIMNAESFGKTVQNFAALSEKKVAAYTMLEFDLHGHTPSEAEAMLAGKIRTSDILGMTEDGALRLILAQAAEKDLAFILPRFEGLDLAVRVLK